jgi:hypothetical protein
MRSSQMKRPTAQPAAKRAPDKKQFRHGGMLAKRSSRLGRTVVRAHACRVCGAWRRFRLTALRLTRGRNCDTVHSTSVHARAVVLLRLPCTAHKAVCTYSKNGGHRRLFVLTQTCVRQCVHAGLLCSSFITWQARAHTQYEVGRYKRSSPQGRDRAKLLLPGYYRACNRLPPWSWGLESIRLGALAQLPAGNRL